uniref:Maturase n=1 Tax=Phacus pleuronectes TaxID=102908 RepID=A0A3G3LLU4_9EUGL|nr:maturase [Phacus pleuronectes]AYQ93677.1 maturase [Phacus pleuronectes]
MLIWFLFFNMSFKFKEVSIFKSKKLLLPGINLKELKCLSSLFQPAHFFVPLIFVSLIAQIVDNLKNVLSVRDIQQLSSIKLYAKLISSDEIVISFSILRAISKTLGSELEIISVLNNKERLFFIKEMENKIANSFSSGKIYSNKIFLFDPILLLKHRLGIALQFRNSFLSTALFRPNSLVVGLSLKEINLQIVLESAKLMWLAFNLKIEEFYFLLYKQALSSFKKYLITKVFDKPKTSIESFKVIIFCRLRTHIFFSRQLVFYEDQVVFRSVDNLVILERELEFIKRPFFDYQRDFFFSNSTITSQDLILKNAIEQRSSQKNWLNYKLKKSHF